MSQCHPVSILDINECNEGTANCSQVCLNAVGSFVCHCHPGYSLGRDGTTCHLGKYHIIARLVEQAQAESGNGVCRIFAPSKAKSSNQALLTGY